MTMTHETWQDPIIDEIQFYNCIIPTPKAKPNPCPFIQSTTDQVSKTKIFRFNLETTGEYGNGMKSDSEGDVTDTSFISDNPKRNVK